jgi:nitroreductase
MAAIASKDLLEQLNWRYAVKQFDPSRKLSAEQWQTLQEALVLTPTSFGLQPWHAVVVTDQATKDKFPPLAWNQQQPKDASHVVVIAARVGVNAGDVDALMARTAEVRGVSVESLAGYAGMIKGFIPQVPNPDAWCAKQAYIACGTLLAAAALIGVDACPMEGIDAAAVDQLLGLRAKGYATQHLVVLGFRHPDDKYQGLKKVRFPAERQITFVK